MRPPAEAPRQAGTKLHWLVADARLAGGHLRAQPPARTLHVDGDGVWVPRLGVPMPAQHQAARRRGGDRADGQHQRCSGQKARHAHGSAILLRAQAAAAEALAAEEQDGGIDEVELHRGQLRKHRRPRGQAHTPVSLVKASCVILKALGIKEKKARERVGAA